MKLYRLILVFIFLTPFFVFASSGSDANITKIITNKENCVKSIEGEKVYLNPQAIYFNQDKIYIQLNPNEFIEVPFLCYDSKGEFLLASVSFYWTCPKCDHKNLFWYRKCQNCGYTPMH